jgi:hypothetical protein
MPSFEPTNEIPTTVRTIRIVLFSDIDEDNPGSLVEKIIARAVVLDQNGQEMETHAANDQKLLQLGLITQQQLDQLQNFVRSFRDDVESVILP